MDVLFCNAVASARTSRLLDEEKLSRMSEAADESEAFKIASESGFGKDATNLASAIAAEDVASATFVREYAPAEPLKAVLLAGYDFHNAEALSKAKHLKLNAEPLLRTDGIYSASEMSDRIMKEEYLSFPIELRDACLETDAAFASGTDGMTVAGIFARAKTRYLIRLTKNKVMRQLLTYHIDTVNIQTCVRAGNFSLAEKMLIPGGTLKDYTLRKICEASPEAVSAEFRLSPYAEYVADVLDAYAAGKAFVAAERRAASRDVAVLKSNRFELGGYLPWVLYVLYKQAEIANVRIISAGLAGKLSGQDIRERLRDGYEG